MYAAISYMVGSIALGLIILDYVWYNQRRVPKGLRLPPGPPRKPIIGNLRDMPKAPEWETAEECSKQYGDMIYMNCFGNSLLFINSEEVAHDLFAKRSSIYSDHYEHTMLNRLAGWEGHLFFMRYGDLWRRQRRLFHQRYNVNAVTKYDPIQIKHSRKLLRNLLDTPDDYAGPLSQLAGGRIMEIVYGIKIKSKGDRFIEIAQTAVQSLVGGLMPWGSLVDFLPSLIYIPKWFPGAKFKRDAARWRPSVLELSNTPYRIVKEQLENGTAKPSLLAADLNALSSRTDVPADEEEVIMNVHGAAYLAGAGTTAAAMKTFVLAMLLYPECQRKAQAELDAVVGVDRLPTFEDRRALPYVEALVSEIQRWYPVLPFALPHASTQDDVYGEYFIPKGTIIIANAWAMLRNEAKYGPNPAVFNPDRFCASGIDRDSMTAMWGFGRRICPGRYLVQNTVFIAVAHILKVFDIVPAKDSQGNEIPVMEEYTTGSFIQPRPFPCVFKPRSELCKKMILEQVIDD